MLLLLKKDIISQYLQRYGLHIVGIALLITFGIYGFFRYFDVDEFEALRSAWKLFQGQRIYIDFFQHHHPLLYYVIKPLFWFTGMSCNALLWARVASISCALAILYYTYRIAKITFDKQTAHLCLLFALSTLMFAARVIEIRPDVPQLLLSLMSTYYMLRYLDRPKRSWLIISALYISAAFFFLQKAIFIGFGLFCLMLQAWFTKRIHMSAILLFCGIAALPFCVYLIYLFFSGFFLEYIRLNWLLNIYMPKEYPFTTLRYTLHTNGMLWFFYLYGLILCPSNDYYKQAIKWLSLWMLCTLFIVKQPDPQYVLHVFPFIFIVSAYAFNQLIAQRQQFVAMLLIILFPITGLLRGMKQSWHEQLDKASYVLSITDEQDTVLDILNRYNIFRNDIDYFWFSDHCRRAYQCCTIYPYDTYELIAQKKPIVIGIESIDNIEHPYIKEHYALGPYNDLLIRNHDDASCFAS